MGNMKQAEMGKAGLQAPRISQALGHCYNRTSGSYSSCLSAFAPDIDTHRSRLGWAIWVFLMSFTGHTELPNYPATEASVLALPAVPPPKMPACHVDASSCPGCSFDDPVPC